MIDTKTADHVDAAGRSLHRIAEMLAGGRIKPTTAAARLEQLARDLDFTVRQANHYLPTYCKGCARVMTVIFRTRDVAGVKCSACSCTRIVSVSPAP